MDQLIKDLLVYGQALHQELAREKLDLNIAVGRVIDDLHAQIQEKKANFEIQPDLGVVWANSSILHQILANLISNALKFVPDSVPPQIRVRSEKKEKSLRLWVEDNGIGIAPEHRDKIFGLFERLHRDEDYAG